MNVCMLWKIKTSNALREVNERECIIVNLMHSGWKRKTTTEIGGLCEKIFCGIGRVLESE